MRKVILLTGIELLKKNLAASKASVTQLTKMKYHGEGDSRKLKNAKERVRVYQELIEDYQRLYGQTKLEDY